jgi:DNA modification methylase
MGLIYKLAQILEDSKAEYLQVKAAAYSETESFGKNTLDNENWLAHGDNLGFMKYLSDERGLKGKLQLIYVDPPFYSKSDYTMDVKVDSDKLTETLKIKQTVYADTWDNGMEDYLKMICARLFMMKDLLCDEGCIWVHLDWHVSHYVKILMDEIFGENNFVNEIIWNYKSGGTSNRRFSRKHDTLLFYGKTNHYYFNPQKEKSYNRGFKPYRFKGVLEYEDEQGWYTMVNMKDVWQIDMVGRTSAERTGYATQKPELLLSRIIESCSREGDLCADFFAGSGTLATSASHMKRRWISCDVGKPSVGNIKKRLIENSLDFRCFMEKPEEIEADSGDIKVEFKLCSCGNKAEKYLQLSIEEYMPCKKWLCSLKDKQRKSIEGVIQMDSLSLIEFWSVDLTYDEKVHRSQIVTLRSKGRIEEKIDLKGEVGRVNILCVDVFGNSVAKTVNE